jgi:hypothetical protein
MSFGDTTKGFNEWALDDEGAEPVFRQAMELGITRRGSCRTAGRSPTSSSLRSSRLLLPAALSMSWLGQQGRVRQPR